MRFDSGPRAWNPPARLLSAPDVPAVSADVATRRSGWLPVATLRPDYELIPMNATRLLTPGHRRPEPSGAICAVSFRAELRPSAREVLSHLLSPQASVMARSRLTGGRSVEEFEAAGSDDSSWSMDSATAAAASLLGLPVREIGHGAAIEALRADTTGLLCGEVIVAVDGDRISTAQQLRSALAGRNRAELSVLDKAAGDEVAPRTVPIARRPDGAWGIRVVTADRLLRHGLDARFNLPADLRGPSLGLACALSIVDAFSGARLAVGGTVVATGTVDLAGRIGGVGAIEYKARAVRAHPQVRRFLVPAESDADVDIARRILAGRAEVVAVTTLAETVHLLSGSSRPGR
ncbi:MAG: S16 family serine protease [Jatrophihabitans sp.]